MGTRSTPVTSLTGASRIKGSRCAPLSVGDRLGIQSVGGQPERVSAPAGEYDVLARFYPLDGARDEGALRSFRLVIELLPRGSVGARCLRLEYGTRPDTIVGPDDVSDD